MTNIYRIIKSSNKDHFDKKNNKGRISVSSDKSSVIFNTKLGNNKWEDENGGLINHGDSIHYQCKTNNYLWDFAFIDGTYESLRAFINTTHVNKFKKMAQNIKIKEVDKGSDFVFFSVGNYDHPEVLSNNGPGNGSGTGSKP